MCVKLQPQLIHFHLSIRYLIYTFPMELKIARERASWKNSPILKWMCPTPPHACFCWWSSATFCFSLALPLAESKGSDCTFESSRHSDTEHRICVTQCKASEIWALILLLWKPLQLLGKPCMLCRCQLALRGERWKPFFLTSQGRKAMKALWEQSSYASWLGPEEEMPTTSLPHLPQQVRVDLELREGNRSGEGWDRRLQTVSRQGGMNVEGD